MSIVARKAKVPHASVYRYFPTKGALIQTLVQETIDAWEIRMRAHLDAARSAAEFSEALHRGFWEIYQASAEQSVLHEMWAAAFIDRTVNRMLVETSKHWTNLYFVAARRFVTSLDDRRLRLRLQLLNEMWDGACRLAVLGSREDADEMMLGAARMFLEELGLPSDCTAQPPRSADAVPTESLAAEPATTNR